MILIGENTWDEVVDLVVSYGFRDAEYNPFTKSFQLGEHDRYSFDYARLLYTKRDGFYVSVSGHWVYEADELVRYADELNLFGTLLGNLQRLAEDEYM